MTNIMIAIAGKTVGDGEGRRHTRGPFGKITAGRLASDALRESPGSSNEN